MISLLFYFLSAYIVGSVPIGYLIARWMGIADIRQHGSGTTGATNVARIVGKQYFFLVLLLDAGKAYGYLWMINAYAQPLLLAAAALGLVLGNTRSLFLHFTGGKGIATLVGIMCYVSMSGLLLFLLSWFVLLASTYVVGIASVGALAATVLFLYGTHTVDVVVVHVLLLLSLWCIYLHRHHIALYLYR